MAERLENHSGDGRFRGYPWSDWTDGSIWRARKGVDYQTDSLRTYLYAKARALDLNVWTRGETDDGESIVFRFTPKEPA